MRGRTQLAGLLGLLISTIPALLGGGTYYYTVLRPRQMAAAADQWRQLPCTIRDIGVDSETTSHRNSSGHRRTSTSYKPRVLFEYQVDGKNYQCEQFWFGRTSFSTRSVVEQMVAAYPTSGQATCYVDPKDPTQAVLSRALYNKQEYAWVWLTAFLFASLIAFLSTVRNSLRQGRGLLSI